MKNTTFVLIPLISGLITEKATIGIDGWLTSLNPFDFRADY